MKLNVKQLTGLAFFVEVENSNSILTLKQNIFELQGIPADSQRLIYRGSEMLDDQLVCYYNLEEGQTIHLVKRKNFATIAASYGTLDSTTTVSPGHTVIPITASNTDSQNMTIGIEYQQLNTNENNNINNKNNNNNNNHNKNNKNNYDNCDKNNKGSIDIMDVARIWRVIRLFAMVDWILTVMIAFWGNILFLCVLPLAICSYIGAKHLKRLPLFLYGIFLLLSIGFRIYLAYLFSTLLVIVLTAAYVLLELYVLAQIVWVFWIIPQLTNNDRRAFHDLSTMFI